MDRFKVELFRGTLGAVTVTGTTEAKGYRSALRKVYQSNKPNMGGQLGIAIWSRVTNLSTGKTYNYFVKLSKRGRILKIE